MMDVDDWLALLALLIAVAALLFRQWPGDDVYRSSTDRRKE